MISACLSLQSHTLRSLAKAQLCRQSTYTCTVHVFQIYVGSLLFVTTLLFKFQQRKTLLTTTWISRLLKNIKITVTKRNKDKRIGTCSIIGFKPVRWTITHGSSFRWFKYYNCTNWSIGWNTQDGIKMIWHYKWTYNNKYISINSSLFQFANSFSRLFILGLFRPQSFQLVFVEANNGQDSRQRTVSYRDPIRPNRDIYITTRTS